MSGVRGPTSGSPRNPLLPAQRHVATDTANGSDPRPNGNRDDDQDDEPARASVEEHREVVVRRLLARGLSPTTVVALLPDFRPLVQRLAEDE